MQNQRSALTGSGRIVNLGATMGAYKIFTPLPREGVGTITFEAKALNDILICFHTSDTPCAGQEGRDDSPPYEIVAGGWQNSRTVIRKRGLIQVQATKTDNPEAVITSRDYVKYWATVEHGRIEFGKGEPGQDPLVRWRDKSPVDSLKFVGFGSWHTPVTIKNVKTMTPIVSDQVLAKKFDTTKMITWYNNEILSDCLISAGSTNFYAHRAVLFCASTKLADLVSSEPSGWLTHQRSLTSSAGVTSPSSERTPIYKLPDELRAGIFLQVLKFVYTGRVVVDLIDPVELGKWAEYFAVVPLVTMCTLFFSNPRGYSQIEMKLNLSRTQAAPRTNLPAASSSGSSSSSSRGLRTSSGPLSSQTMRAFADFARLFQNELFSDVTFVLTENGEAVEIKAHRIIMAMQSEPFYLMFINPMRENTERRVHVNEDAATFRQLLEYLYTGRLPQLDTLRLEEDLVPLLSVGNRYSIFPLRSTISDILIERLDASNACLILSVANFFSLNSVRGEALAFIEQNFADVVKSSGFLQLDAISLMEIVFDDNLKVKSERDVYDALMHWGTASESSDTDSPEPVRAQSSDSPLSSSPTEGIDVETRHSQLQQLLSYVRFPLLPQDFLRSILKTNTFIEKTPYLRKLVEESIVSRRRSVGTDDEQFRVIQRKSEHLEELFFSQPGDENGVIFWIGSAGRTQKFQNPHRSGKVKVSCSSPSSRFTRLDALTGRTFVSCNHASGDSRSPAWWAVDLGINYRLQCNHYSLQTDGSGVKLSDWLLQGSNDGSSWDVLQAHVSDTSWRSGAILNWSVPEQLLEDGQPQSYRHFRVLVSGNSAKAAHKLAICGIELYGYLEDLTRTTQQIASPTPPV